MPIKGIGILSIFVGLGCLIPVSTGSPKRGLNHFDYLAGSPPLIPLGWWLILGGAIAIGIGSLISRDWGIF